ncbi:MAG: FAD-dependent oxidoreductase [Pseudomonadota bacterium]
MTTTLTPDICVIGGGSGGLTVAAAAASFGVDVVLLEKGKMGGDCLNYGCVPSKAIIAAGKHAQSAREGHKYGVNLPEPEVDYKAVHNHIHDVIGTIAPNDSVERFTSLGVNVIEEAGEFIDANTVRAGDYEIKARRFVVATGSSAFVPPIPGLQDVDYLTNESLWDLTKLPKHLIVIGGGPIGMEMAQAHRRLGSEVTVIEGMKVFGKDDPELVALLVERLREEGIDIREGAKVSRIEKRGKTGVKVIAEIDGEEVAFDGSHVLVATGRAANVNGLGLEAAGIEYDRRGITVNKKMNTTNKRVLAIGDVAGSLQFTHMAGYHAGIAIRNILFRLGAKENVEIIPWATYTQPELSHVGLNESQAVERFGDKAQILRFPYAENDRAIAERKTLGLIKVLADGKGRVVGASIVGEGAGEMINMWALAVTHKMKLKDITAYVPPYPTMGEIGRRAAVTSFAPATKKPVVRNIIGLLQKLG